MICFVSERIEKIKYLQKERKKRSCFHNYPYAKLAHFNLFFHFSLLPGDLANARQNGQNFRQADLWQSFLLTDEIYTHQEGVPFQVFGIQGM